MFAAVARYLANVTGPTGTLLVLDDLQWAGVDALDLLATLLRTPGEQPLRVVGAYRSTEVHPPDPLGSLLADLGAGGLADEIRLGPLAPEEAAGLLQSILEGHEGAGDALREQVLTRTGGVPFFLVSCARALQMGVTGDDLPWDVAQHLRQRIAALPQAAQELLGMAAVVGREAPAAFLLRLALQPEQATLSALEALNQARLLIEVGAETVQFAHDLIREVVLADLSATRRRVWHRRVAETLEQEPGVPSIERLAYHYAQAGLDATAVIFLEQAGDHAQALHANSEAEGYYRELVVRLEKLGRQVESGQAREKLARMLSAQTRYHEVLAVLEQAAAAYRASGDIEGEGRVTAHIGLTHVLRGSLVEGIARVHHLLEGALSQALSAQGLGYLYDALAQLFQHSTRYSEQLAAADRACAYAQQAQDTQLLARAKASYGLALAYLDRTVEAIPWLEAAVSLRHTSDLQNYAAKARVNTSQIENPQVFPEMLHLLALQAFLEGDWDQSLAHLELARSLLDQETNAWVLAQVLIGLGAVKLFRGQGEGAQDLMEAHRLSAHPFIEQWIVILLSEGELVCGDAPAASARLEPLLEEPSIFTDYVLIGMGWAALKSDPGKAAALIEQGITVARSSQSQRGLTDGLRIQALLALQQRQWPTAEQALEEALQVSRSMPFPYGEAKALYVYGLLHQAKGEPEAARERLEAALTMLNRLGERLYAEQVERALAEGRRP